MLSTFTRTMAAALVVGVLATGVGEPVASTASVPAARPDVGVQFHGLWSIYTNAQREEILTRMQNAGIRTVRIDVSWAMLQPYNHYSFDPWGASFVDKVVAMANAHGITPLMTLWLTPGWANDYAGDHVLPNNPADYARVAQWAAARYRNQVAGWEVWNEPNSPAFMAGADPAAYTRLLQAAYPAFHAGYAGTTVVFGGLEYNDDRWLRRAYDAGAHGFFDVVGVHPYMGMANLPPDTADDGTIWTLMHVVAVRALMIARGDGGRSIWFTEFGWSTHENPIGTPNYALGVSEDIQAQYFTQTITLVRAAMPWVGKVYWYTEPGAGSDDQHRNYSVLRLDLSPKPIMAAIAAVLGGF